MTETSTYATFLDRKAILDVPQGFSVTDIPETYQLFPFQEDLVRWACQRGRAAIFADTGLGKTRIQLAWADQVSKQTQRCILIFAPLCVAHQTIREAEKMGISVTYLRRLEDFDGTGIFITNYELLDHFTDALVRGAYVGVVLDESSIMKHQDSKTRLRLTDACLTIPYKLSCTATPSPNDYMELGNQAEWLGIMDADNMLALFFTHDGGHTTKWILKGHGRDAFWTWLSSWTAFIQTPKDLGYVDDRYTLPPLSMQTHIVSTLTEHTALHPLFNEYRRRDTAGGGLVNRHHLRKTTLDARVQSCAELISSTPGQWIVWCYLNDESRKLAAAIEGAEEIRGDHAIEEKETRLLAFTEGRLRVLITKPSIAGFGLNWQHCHQMAYVGLTDSYEQVYQGIRRCYRFGQSSPVQIHFFISDLEDSTLQNIERKHTQHLALTGRMVTYMHTLKERMTAQHREQDPYQETMATGEDWTLLLGDCVTRLAPQAEASIDYSIFSPPFSSLYCYTNSDRDMGNSRTHDEFFEHFDFLIAELFRVLKPGRLCSVHCMNLPTSKVRDGIIGLYDFRGEIIRRFVGHHWIYHAEVCIWKDLVVAMQRTKALGLLWKQLKKDSAMSRMGVPDYVLTFRKPGENPRPLFHDPKEFSVEEWQKLASPVWFDIQQNNTLNKHGARDDDDVRHIAPLQLDVIQRCLRLWTNPGDRVLSPFAGIGSEGVVARKMGRSFLGIELKSSYYELAKKNLAIALPEEAWQTCTNASLLHQVRTVKHLKSQTQLTALVEAIQ